MRYESITLLQTNYSKSLKSEIKNREIEKENLFHESKLNIKLNKFAGYDSLVDIYTFQSDFEKVYSRTTPKRLMPDLLKNNHLDEPALSLVRFMDNIDEIWTRLKDSYGDTKMMLIKKLSEVGKMESLSKVNDPEKLISGLSKITNVIRDLIKLSKKHNMERRLYFGDGLDRIYKLLGDSRVTRWFTII